MKIFCTHFILVTSGLFQHALSQTSTKPAQSSPVVTQPQHVGQAPAAPFPSSFGYSSQSYSAGPAASVLPVAPPILIPKTTYVPPPPPPTGFRSGGGVVLKQMVVHPIYWGQTGTVVAAIQPSLDLMYSELVKTNYVHLTQYGVQSVAFNASVFIVANSQPSIDDTQDIQSFLRSLVSQGTIVPTQNTYFPLYLFANTVSFGSLNSCADFCYYRNSVEISDLVPGVSKLYYGVFPLFLLPCAPCAPISVIGNLMMSSAMALVSAATNPSATNPLAQAPGEPAAGYTDVATGASVGEYCSVALGIQKLEQVVTPAQRHFLLPPVWSQSMKGCTADFQNLVKPVGTPVGAPA
ncbi:hypothetical protein HDU98_009453 [Podochytrium sp. JEL0797]|nr:hypothetical protein HDU98_009453 [Podochytrium sp. JEL0797]